MDNEIAPVNSMAFALHQPALFEVVDYHGNVAATPKNFFPDQPVGI
jgi:hypothetical protein